MTSSRLSSGRGHRWRGFGFACVIGWLLVAFVIHELGHFVVAQLFDVRVERFVIGMGPKLASVQIGETEFALQAFPFGAANEVTEGIIINNQPADPMQLFLLSQDKQALAQIAQKNPEAAELIPIYNRWYSQRDPVERFAMVAAGPLMNLLVAAILTIIATVLPERKCITQRDGAPRPFAHDEPMEMFLDAMFLPLYFVTRRVKSADLCGPLGILDEGERLVGEGIRGNLALLSSLSVALGLFNLFKKTGKDP